MNINILFSDERQVRINEFTFGRKLAISVGATSKYPFIRGDGEGMYLLYWNSDKNWVVGYYWWPDYFSILEDNIWSELYIIFRTTTTCSRTTMPPYTIAFVANLYTARNGLNCRGLSPDINIYLLKTLQTWVINVNSSDNLYNDIVRIWQSTANDFI